MEQADKCDSGRIGNLERSDGMHPALATDMGRKSGNGRQCHCGILCTASKPRCAATSLRTSSVWHDSSQMRSQEHISRHTHLLVSLWGGGGLKGGGCTSRTGHCTGDPAMALAPHSTLPSHACCQGCMCLIWGHRLPDPNLFTIICLLFVTFVSAFILIY